MWRHRWRLSAGAGKRGRFFGDGSKERPQDRPSAAGGCPAGGAAAGTLEPVTCAYEVVTAKPVDFDAFAETYATAKNASYNAAADPGGGGDGAGDL